MTFVHMPDFYDDTRCCGSNLSHSTLSQIQQMIREADTNGDGEIGM